MTDPPGFQTELRSELGSESALDRWLYEGAVRLAADQPLSAAIDRLAEHPDSRACLLLLGEMLAMPGLVEQLSETLLAKERP